MKNDRIYKVRPLFTSQEGKRKRFREAAFLAAGAVCKLIPEQFAAKARRMCGHLSHGGAFSTDQYPVEGMMVQSLETAPDNEQAIVSELTDSFASAKRAQAKVASPYQPGAGWKDLLENQWSRYIRAADQKDINTLADFLRNFFRNEGISGFWGGDRMFESFAGDSGVANVRRAFTMRRQFEAWREAMPDTPVEELELPPVGNPWGYVVEGALVIEPACEYHLQARQFAKMLSTVPEPVIAEIGGGFGGLAYQIMKQVPNVKYIGFDLPENTFIQSYFLSCAFPDKKILTYRDGVEKISREDIENHDMVLLPNFLIPAMEAGTADMVINIRSLSEMPFRTIEEYLGQIERISRLFFFHENLFKKRLDNLHGIPGSQFPQLDNLVLLSESESRWPRYGKDSVYPCHEYIYIHKSALKNTR